jgi:hypothetical protein
VRLDLLLFFSRKVWQRPTGKRIGRSRYFLGQTKKLRKTFFVSSTFFCEKKVAKKAALYSSLTRYEFTH